MQIETGQLLKVGGAIVAFIIILPKLIDWYNKVSGFMDSLKEKGREEEKSNQLLKKLSETIEGNHKELQGDIKRLEENTDKRFQNLEDHRKEVQDKRDQEVQGYRKKTTKQLDAMEKKLDRMCENYDIDYANRNERCLRNEVRILASLDEKGMTLKDLIRLDKQGGIE